MDLVSRLLLGLARLAAGTRAGLAPLEAESPEVLLRAALGELGGDSAAASQAFGVHIAHAERQAALAQLTQALERALREQSRQAKAGELADVIETLLLAGGVVREVSLAQVQLQFNSAALFQALRLLRLGESAEGAQVLLVGTLAISNAALTIPLRLVTPLDGLALRYEAEMDAPQLQTDLWLRVPPDPNKRRLAEWSPALLNAASRIELYRQLLPGQEPAAEIIHEHIPLPHALNVAHLSVQLGDPGDGLIALRTTIRDKYHSPLAITERIIARP